MNLPGAFFTNQKLHLLVDLVADRADGIKRLSFGIKQWPIQSSETGNERAGFAASHCDQQGRLAGQVIGQFLGMVCTEVDPNLAHHLDHFRVYLSRGLCPR